MTAAALALAATGCGGGGGGPTTATTKGPPQAAGAEFAPNVARVPGRVPSDVAARALLAVYPPERSRAPSAWVLPRDDDWHYTALAGQIAAAPVGAAVIPTNRDFLPSGTFDTLARIKVKEFPRGKGLQVLILGKSGNDVFTDLQDQGLKFTQLTATDPTRLASQIVPYRGGWAHKFSSSVVIAPLAGRDYALSAAAWTAFSGDTLAFAGRNSVPATTAKLLAQRRRLLLERPSIYVIAPPRAISDAVLAKLRAYGPVKRVAGPTPAATSVALARFHDPATGFGWGLKRGSANLTLMNQNDWGNLAAAFTYASAQGAPLLLTDSATRMPGSVGAYLRSIRAGRSSQGFVLGDAKSVSSALLHRFDAALAAR